MGAKRRQVKTAVSNLPRRSGGGDYSLYRYACAVGLLIICCLLVVIGAQYIRQRSAEQKLAELESQISGHEDRQLALEDEIYRLHDLEYIEVLARRRLGLVKPDEVIFQIED